MEPSGGSRVDEKTALAVRLMDELSQIREPDTGQLLLANLFGSDELYTRPTTKDAPDFTDGTFRSQGKIRTRQPAPFRGKLHNRYFIAQR